MPLIPAQDDPNRKAELDRAKKDPSAFDADPIKGSARKINPFESGLVEDKKHTITKPK